VHSLVGLQSVGDGIATVMGVRRRRQWRAVVNAVMNLRVKVIRGEFLDQQKNIVISERTVLVGVSSVVRKRGG